MDKKVFNVSRVPKTAKSVNVGDFETLQEAEKAMVEHFKATPKRGNFYYLIGEEVITEMGGMTYRTSTFDCYGNGHYLKRYTPEAIKAMMGGN